LTGIAGGIVYKYARDIARSSKICWSIWDSLGSTELAREWRTDRVLRRLEALMVVVSTDHSLLITGQGDVIQPSNGIIGIGSGGPYALAAARALVKNSTLTATQIVRQSLEIAAEIDICTNSNTNVDELAAKSHS
jgi:ATP-dependent HslUV protease subunit HslV